MSLVYFIRNWDKLIPEERLSYLKFINNQIISNNKITNKEDEDFIKLYKILEKNYQVSSSDLLFTLDTYNISPLIYEYFENLVKVK
jgi:uncharacterized protein YfkK (UPF0435 family)